MAQISHPWIRGENAWTGLMWFEPGITTTCPTIPGTGYFRKEKATARMLGHSDSCLYAPKFRACVISEKRALLGRLDTVTRACIHQNPFESTQNHQNSLTHVSHNFPEPILTHALSLSVAFVSNVQSPLQLYHCCIKSRCFIDTQWHNMQIMGKWMTPLLKDPTQLFVIQFWAFHKVQQTTFEVSSL